MAMGNRAKNQSPFGSHSWSAVELKAIIEAERIGVSFLLLRKPDGVQSIIPLPDFESSGLTVGRSAECDLDLTGDDLVSRTHCRLDRLGGSWTVEDIGPSRNGTFVNGTRVTGKIRLSDGDVIKVGQTHVMFRSPVAQSSMTTVIGVASSNETPAVSPAQLRVLEALARPCIQSGRFTAPATNDQIASELFLSVDTVKTHIKSLFQTFDLNDEPRSVKRIKLVELAITSGTISLTAPDSNETAS